MDNVSDNKKPKLSNKSLALIICSVAFFLIAGSVSAYFLYYLPKQQEDALTFQKQKYEAEQWEKEKQKQDEEAAAVAAAQAEEQRKIDLNMCLTNADLSYTDQWSESCKTWKQIVDKDWKTCRANKLYMQTDAENKQYCIRTTFDYIVDSDGTCRLPKTYSDSITENRKNRRDECYKQYQ